MEDGVRVWKVYLAFLGMATSYFLSAQAMESWSSCQGNPVLKGHREAAVLQSA